MPVQMQPGRGTTLDDDVEEAPEHLQPVALPDARQTRVVGQPPRLGQGATQQELDLRVGAAQFATARPFLPNRPLVRVTLDSSTKM